jgi:hypothetical protein
MACSKREELWVCKAPSMRLSSLARKHELTQNAMRVESNAVRAFVSFITTWGSKQNLSKLLTHIKNLQCFTQFVKRQSYNLCNAFLEKSLLKNTPERNTIHAWDKQFLGAGYLCTGKSFGSLRV